MNSSSPFTDVPRTTPPPSFSQHPFPGDKLGLCGLTGDQWHMVMIFSIPLSIALLIAFVISWLNDSEISFLWLRVQERAKMTRMDLRERLFGHLLSEDDVRSGLIITGPSITPRRYPVVNFILAQLRAPPPNENQP